MDTVLKKSAYGFDGDALKAIGARIKAGEQVSPAEAIAYQYYREEVSAHAVEIMLGTESFIDRVIRTDAPLAEKIIGKIVDLKEAFGRIGDSEAQAQHKRLAEAEKMYLNAIEAAGKKYQNSKIVSATDEDDEEKEKTAESGGKYSLAVMEVNGDVHVVNPFSVTKEDIVKFLGMSRRGLLENNSYFPVSAHTSSTIIATLENIGVDISDRPIAMQAAKARQAQMEGEPLKKDGVTIRPHAMKDEEIVEAINKLSTPDAIIQQTNRTKKIKVDGKKKIISAPDNFVIFVTLDSGKECVAVIEFDSEIDSRYILNDGEGEEFHTTVTVFVPDVIRNGIPFDYMEYLLLNDSNRPLDIIEESPKTETAYSETDATVSEKELSASIIPQNSEKSTPKGKFSFKEDSDIDNSDMSNGGFVGSVTGLHYNEQQARLLSALSVEALKNAADANVVSFNVIGLGNNKSIQKEWVDAGLAYEEDGNIFVEENAVLDERDRRRYANKATKAEADNKKPTSYTKAEAEEMVSGILTDFFSAPEYAGKIKNMSDAVKMAMATLNGAEAGKRLGPAQKLADYIIAQI